MHSFHSDPVVVNEFPSRLKPHGFACFLPFADVEDAHVIEVVEAVNSPVRTVFDGLKVGFHLDLKISGGRPLEQGCRSVTEEELEQDVPTTDWYDMFQPRFNPESA